MVKPHRQRPSEEWGVARCIRLSALYRGSSGLKSKHIRTPEQFGVIGKGLGRGKD